MNFADDLERQTQIDQKPDALWADLVRAEREVKPGRTPFAEWNAKAQARLARDVGAAEAEGEVTMPREEYLRDIERSSFLGYQSGYNKGWAEAWVATARAKRRWLAAGCFWGAVLAAAVILLLKG